MNRYSNYLAILLASGIFAGGVTAFAQEKSQPNGMSSEQALQVTSRLVTLDVVVVDRNGNFVDGLDQSKFHVTDAKVPQKVRNFEAPALHVMPSPGTALVHSSEDLPKIGNAPVNVLVIDELNTPFPQIAYTQQMMVRYLKGQPEILTQPTLFIAVGASHIAVLHDFTQDRDALIESVKHHVTETDFEFMIASLNGGRAGTIGGFGRTLGSMLQLANAMRGFPGRKNVIWVGTGYKRSGDGRSLQNGSSSDKVLLSAGRAIRMVTNQMLGAHITLYTMDPEGPAYHSGNPFPAGSPGDSSWSNGPYGNMPDSSFEKFAYSTGGQVLWGRNDIETAVKEMATEGSRYYTMAFVPSGVNFSDESHPYHAVRVTLDDPNLRVITRDGYFGGTEIVPRANSNAEKEQPRLLRFDLLNAATTTLTYTALHTEVATTKDGYALLVLGKDLHWTPEADGSQRAEVTVMAVCYGDKDKELSQHAAQLTEVLDPTDKLGPENRVGLAFPLKVPPGTRRVRFVLRDANNGMMGSANFSMPPAVAQVARP